MKGTRNRLHGIFALLAFGAVIAITMPAAASVTRAFKDTRHTKAFWHQATAKPAALGHGVRPVLKLRSQHVRSFALNRVSLHRVLAAAPRERTRAARLHPLVVSFPAPNGKFQRFALQQSAIMAPGLARTHPEIKTYSGRGIDDRAATIHADLSPIGFHASVRSPDGAWYIDPYYRNSQSRYVSYFGRDVANSMGPLVERDASGAELSVDKGYYHAVDSVTLRGSTFAENADVTITISDPEEQFASRTLHVQSDAQGSFSASFVADPDGNLETHIVSADDGSDSTSTSYQVVRDDDPTVDPPTGDVQRNYRLALITDPGYAAYSGGPSFVTAAKVALINRVDQVYEDDLSIRMQLIANNDLLEPRHVGSGDRAERPLRLGRLLHAVPGHGLREHDTGQVRDRSDHRRVELRHRPPRARPAGGGVANLGVVGRSNKAGGCTGIPTPVGDFYAIDYVAHEMGHQFSGNHPFNGNQLNCSGGNRNASTSVEPGSGSSIMAYAGICLTDDLQPHSDPYFSERSQQEISTYTSSNQAAINEVQTASLRHFGGGNEVQTVTFGPGYQPVATIQPLSGGDWRRSQLDAAGRRVGGRKHGHDLDRRRGCDAHAAARRLGNDLGRGRCRLQRDVHGRFRPDVQGVHLHQPDLRARPLGRRHDHAQRAGPDRIRQHRDGQDCGRPQPLGRRHRRHRRSRSSRLQRHLDGRLRSERSFLHVHEPDRRPGQLRRRDRDLQLAVPGTDRRKRLGRDRRLEPGSTATPTSRPRSTRSRASPARSP